MSGTGPAFTFLFLEGLIEAGVRLGLDWDLARNLAIQTVKGAAILAQESEVHLAQLRNEVTSPGGTAAAGLQVMESSAFKAIISQAVEAASGRADELGRE
jgi:pyrroline-5-carboxylate reductase